LDPAIEKTITNVAIEISYGKELEALESCINDEVQHPFSIKKCLEDQLVSNKYNLDTEILSENISTRTSVSESVTDSETIPAVVPHNTVYSVDYSSLPISTTTESNYESRGKYISESSNEIMIHETDFIASLVNHPSENTNMYEKKENSSDFYGLSISPRPSLDILTPQSMSIVNELETNTNEATQNLRKMNLIDEETTLKYSNIEEEEVNNLVNKIVVDVISHAIQTDVAPNQQEIDFIENTFAQIHLDHSDSEVLEKISSPSNIDNNCDEYKTNEDSKLEKEIIEEATSNEHVKNNLPKTNDLVETSSKEIDSIFKLSENKNAGTSSSSKTDNKVHKKEPVVDCFSCTIV